MMLFYGVCSAQMTPRAIDSIIQILPAMKEDSVKVNTLNLLAQNLKKSNPTNGRLYAQNALSISQRLQWGDGIASSYRSIAVIMSASGEYENALQFFDKAINSTSNKVIKSRIFRGIAKVYTEQANFAKALDYNNRSLKLCEETGDKQGEAIILSNISVVYIELGDLEKAREYRQRALNTDKKTVNAFSLIRSSKAVESNKSFSDNNQHEKSLKFIESNTDNNLNTSANATSLTAKAIINYSAGELKVAKFHNEKAMSINRFLNDSRNLSMNLQLMGDILFEQATKEDDLQFKRKLTSQAIQSLNECIKIQSKLHLLKNIRNAYNTMSKVQALQGNYKQSLKSYQTSIIYKDSVFNAENRETIKNLEDKRTIEVRDKQILLNDLAMESEQKQKLLYILGIALLSSIGLLLLYQNQLRKKSNRALIIVNDELDAANKIKTRFFSILNHDLRAPVSNIIHFLHLQKDSPELLTEESKLRMENKTISSAENLLESMEDILLWSKGQMENFSPEPRNIPVDLLFDDIQKHFLSTENVKIFFENAEKLTLYTDQNYVKTILRNLTGNAITALEGTQNAKIHLKAWKEKGQNYISVSDNGPGGTQEKFRALYDEKEVVGIKTGLGLHLIRDLAKAIDCKIEVKAKPEDGTVFTLKFNLFLQ